MDTGLCCHAELRRCKPLGIPESQLGVLGAVVRAGAFLSVILAIAADRWGRRALLLLTVLGYTFFTGATAFSPNAETFVVFQFFARGFASAEVMIAAVVIAEEFPPENRGWGIGALAALQALGAGLAIHSHRFLMRFDKRLVNVAEYGTDAHPDSFIRIFADGDGFC